MSSKTVLLLILLVMLPSAMLGARFIVPVEGALGIIEVGPDESIQDAIDAASAGDTIYVYNGTYYENVVINKNNLTLIGESRDNTVIDGGETYYVVYVTANYVNISGFTIRNGKYFDGVYLNYSSHNTIVGNIITNNFYGIFLDNCSDTTISDNTVVYNQHGIGLRSSSGNIISGNTISNSFCARGRGIYLYGASSENTISSNTISDNNNGVYLSSCCNSNTIYHNNFINNKEQAFSESINPIWDDGYPSGGNYWSDYTGDDFYSGPGQDEPGSDGIGDDPYVINTENRDNYPFMNPWGWDNTPPVTIDDYDGLWHTTDFTITLTATDDISGVVETYYRINYGPTKNVGVDGQPIITTESGNNTLEYWSVDLAGNEETPHNVLANIKLDKTVPSGSIVINNGDAYTTSSSVTLTLTATDATSAVYQVRYSNDGVWDTEPWEDFLTTKTWTLTSGDETKTVYYQIKDNAGLVSSTYSDTIILDIIPPTGSITINDGATYTTATTVTLTLSATDATSGVAEMCFSNDNINYTDWQTYASSKSWTLQAGDGSKTVYVQFRDQAGLISTYSDTIILDTTPPTTTISLSEVVGSNGWFTSDVTVTLSATGDISGVDKTEYSFDNTTWTIYTTPFTITNEGYTIVYYRSTDKAGNVETIKTETIKIDKTKPFIDTPSQEPPESHVEPNQKVTVSVNVTDDHSGVREVVLQYRYSIDGGQTWTMWTDVMMSKSTGGTYEGEILGLPAGTRVQYVITAYDNADNAAVKDEAGQYFVYTVIPEFPTWTVVLVTFCILSVALILLRRKMQPSHKTAEMNTSFLSPLTSDSSGNTKESCI